MWRSPGNDRALFAVRGTAEDEACSYLTLTCNYHEKHLQHDLQVRTEASRRGSMSHMLCITSSRVRILSFRPTRRLGHTSGRPLVRRWLVVIHEFDVLLLPVLRCPLAPLGKVVSSRHACVCFWPNRIPPPSNGPRAVVILGRSPQDVQVRNGPDPCLLVGEDVGFYAVFATMGYEFLMGPCAERLTEVRPCLHGATAAQPRAARTATAATHLGRLLEIIRSNHPFFRTSTRSPGCGPPPWEAGSCCGGMAAYTTI